MTTEEITFLHNVFSHWAGIFKYKCERHFPHYSNEDCAAEQLEAMWRGLA